MELINAIVWTTAIVFMFTMACCVAIVCPVAKAFSRIRDIDN